MLKYLYFCGDCTFCAWITILWWYSVSYEPFYAFCLFIRFLVLFSFLSSFLSSPLAHPHGVGMLQFMSNMNQPSLPTPFYSVLVSISLFMALSTVFHSINSPDNSPFSLSVLPVVSLPYWSFQLYISL